MSLEPAPAARPEPKLGFEDSRRLTGANRFFGGPAVTLTPLGPQAASGAAHAQWCETVQQMAAALGWPAAQARAVCHAQGAFLVFAAAADQLYTATEVAEWAWEQVNAAAGVAAFDLAQPSGGPQAVLPHFQQRAKAEIQPSLKALQDAATSRGLPHFTDDDAFSIGTARDSATWPLRTLPPRVDVPWPRLSAPTPIVLVTGSNGKTSTVRLLSSIAIQAGYVAGHCCTEGVFLNGHAIERGDWSGPAGARAVLRHPHVTAAVLETARGGILRRGLAVQSADVALVTNISADHFGEYGIDSLQELAEVKLVVAHAVADAPLRPDGRGRLVLNADDAVLMATAERLPHAQRASKALFSLDDTHPALQALRAAGGWTLGLDAGEMVLSMGSAQRHCLGQVKDMPLTLGGAASFHIQNLSAAALAAACLGWPVSALRAVLARFGARPQDNPGRLERYTYRGATVLIDYAHNPEGLAQLLTVAKALAPQRLLLLLGQAGNREDTAIADLARTAAGFEPDEIWLKRMPTQYLRGRPADEVPTLLKRALLESGCAADRIVDVQPLPAGQAPDPSDEEAIAWRMLQNAQAGDVLVLPLHDAVMRQRVAQGLGS